MGIMQHNAILATTWNENDFKAVLEWLDANVDSEHRKLFIHGAGICNGEQTIVMIPDGSKEGWSESDIGNRLRAAFIGYLKTVVYLDGSSCWKWIEVGYGEFGPKIEDSNTHNCYGD